MRCIDHIGLNLQVVADKVGRIGVVGVNAAHPGRGQKDKLRALLGKKCVHRLRLLQIQIGVGAKEEISETAALQAPHQGRSGKSAMSRHKDAAVLFHTFSLACKAHGSNPCHPAAPCILTKGFHSH
jgi:hypothetical protein